MKAIQIDSLWKEYRLGVINHGTLVKDFQSWWARLRGIEDPNSLITIDEAESCGVNAGKVNALRDINLEINQGEILGIIGRNGAGKSTLLKILSKVTSPTRGCIRTRGRIASLLEVGTGFHPELTGRENVFLNGAILGMSKEEIKQKFDEIVEFAELNHFIDTPVKRYSSGMYVRLAFAVAAHLETEIIVVDEVLAVGDVVFQRKCLGKMKDVSSAGRTVLFVSHNMNAIKNLCTRAILIDQGCLTMDADPESVVARYLDRNLVEGPIVSEREIEKRIEGVIKKQYPHFRILEIRMENEQGMAASKFESTEPVIVQVKYRVFQKVNDLRILVAVADEMGTSIYGSQNTDDNSTAEQFYEIEPGDYIARCVLPANIFANKKYHLNIDVVSPKKEHHVLKKILEFEIEFHGYNSEIQYGGNNLDFFLWPKMSWQAEKIDTATGV
ncbi:ABC transporter ATP-binding protein [Desulfogranum mediterraneum]|uniref:ABC transporter ATP-binding protein n=1 Tax=Desulfogranum mediterraneum TaxID=160661 RepID=UPI00048F135C|nr:ABC transporter ATP-binding protein [Desulfogranum mediterraneum]